MTKVLYFAYLFILGMLSVLSLVRYSKTDIGTRFISWMIWLGLATELIAWIMARNIHNNLAVYNISCIIEWVLICLYFNFNISGFIFASLGIVAGIANIFLFQSISSIDSNFLFMECVGVVSQSLYAIYKLLKVDDDDLKLYRETLFWIPVILLFYQCGALWSWVTYDYYRIADKSATPLLHSLLLSNSIITYSLLFVLYAFYPKMKRGYV